MSGSRPRRPEEGFSDTLWEAVKKCWMRPNDRHTSIEFIGVLFGDTTEEPIYFSIENDSESLLEIIPF